MARFLSRGAAVLAVLVAGCGSSDGSERPDTTATLLLESAPSAVHAGIYLAVQRGYDDTEGVELELRAEGDPVELLTTGRAQFALMPDAELRAAGEPLVGVMAVVQEPLLALVVTKDTLADRESEVRAVIRALQRGYVEAQTDPESAVGALVEGVEGLDRERMLSEFEALSPALTAGAPVFGATPQDGPYDGSLVGPVSRD